MCASSSSGTLKLKHFVNDWSTSVIIGYPCDVDMSSGDNITMKNNILAMMADKLRLVAEDIMFTAP